MHCRKWVMIVYKTDALMDKGVRIVDSFPDAKHPSITYPIAMYNDRSTQ